MLCLLLIAAGMGLVPKPIGPTPAPVTLTTRDRVTVFADAYPAAIPNAPVLLLFHQAGSGKGEYAPLGPRLALLGYNALAIDQRSGGAMYGENQTLAHIGKPSPFLSVLPDMEAALAWAKRVHPGAKVVLVGSSYSASLAFVLAARHPREIAAVAAFSPGEYFDDKAMVRRAARTVTVPVFIDSGNDPTEIANAKLIYDAAGSHDKREYVPRSGIHGASTLRDDRDPAGALDNWNAFVAFLRRVTGR